MSNLCCSHLCIAHAGELAAVTHQVLSPWCGLYELDRFSLTALIDQTLALTFIQCAIVALWKICNCWARSQLVNKHIIWIWSGAVAEDAMQQANPRQRTVGHRARHGEEKRESRGSQCLVKTTRLAKNGAISDNGVCLDGSSWKGWLCFDI